MSAKIEYTKNFVHPNQFSINGHDSVSTHYVETDLLPEGTHDECHINVMMPDTLEIMPITWAVSEGILKYGWRNLLDENGNVFVDGLMEVSK